MHFLFRDACDRFGRAVIEEGHMVLSKIIGKGAAIKILSFIEEVGPDKKHVITILDDQGNPECNAFGDTHDKAMHDLYAKGYQIVMDSFAKGERIHWKTKRI